MGWAKRHYLEMQLSAPPAAPKPVSSPALLPGSQSGPTGRCLSGSL